MFHNTVEATGKELSQYRHKASSQDAKVLAWFRTYEQSATPSKVWKLVFDNRVPLTSVRRSLSNLTASGDLVKTDQQKRGIYGRPEGVWALPRNTQRMLL